MLSHEELKTLAKNNRVPIRINLMTRMNSCETVLDFVGADNGEYRYLIGASYQYSVWGDDPVIAIDFSEGPTLHIGDTIEKMKIERFELPYIIFKK